MSDARDVIASTRYGHHVDPDHGPCFKIIGPEKADAILSALNSAGLSPPEWLPIETAPKGGDVLLFGFYFYPGDKHRTEYMAIGEWTPDGWHDDEGVKPDGVYSHWMPLPPPPKEK